MKLMLPNCQSSDRKLKQCLIQTLKKEKELSNRIGVLMIEKEKKLKIIENRINKKQEENGLKMEKTIRKQAVQRSFQDEKRLQKSNIKLFRELKENLFSSIHLKKDNLLETRRKWHEQIKKSSELNCNKILQNKSRQVQSKRINHKKVKLMEINSKENIKRYWNERAEYIQKQKWIQAEESMNNLKTSNDHITMLQRKQQKLLEQIQRSIHFEQIIQTPMNEWNQQYIGEIKVRALQQQIKDLNSSQIK